jgi:hypothetical protein
MEFRTLDPIEGRKQALAARINQLEQEYLNNETALLVSENLPESESKEAQVKQFNYNLAVIESAHKAIVAEHDSL